MARERSRPNEETPLQVHLERAAAKRRARESGATDAELERLNEHYQARLDAAIERRDGVKES